MARAALNRPSRARSGVAHGRRRAAPSRDFAVVGIGTSASGLEAVGRLLAELPADSGFAFVVVLHLHAGGPAALADQLRKRTNIEVSTAADGIVVEAGHVYVVPHAVHPSIADGRLRLSALDAGAPIDVFLRSLAADCGRRGIGIILSGSGNDGAEGLRALKEAGGLTLVQDPGEALHGDMPRRAMLAGRPDFVLPVRDMPAVMRRYLQTAYARAQGAEGEDPAAEMVTEAGAVTVVDALRQLTGKDLGRYKAAMLRCRIERRMALNGIDAVADYLALVRTGPAEAEALLRDLPAKVTGFFRDGAALAALARHASASLRSRAADRTFRAWVVGCGTGEEAYSLGILLLEQAAMLGLRPALQIFATDLDEGALEVARAGVYSDIIRADITAERLGRFFVRDGGRFRVSRELRRIFTFSPHDVLNDPPFSRLDLLSSRNILSHLLPAAQRQALAAFGFALADGGLLMLGPGEPVKADLRLFEALDTRSGIYRRGVGDRAARLHLGAARRLRGPGPRGEPVRSPPSLPETVERMMLDVYAPAAVVVSADLEPVYYFGGVDRYLRIGPGEPRQDVLSIARDGLRGQLDEVIARAFRARRRVAAHGITMKGGRTISTVTLEARRVPDERDDLVLVSFVDEPARTAPGRPAPAGKREARFAATPLRQRLAEMRRELTRAMRELRRASQDLKARDEELMSLSEEFLSTKEELESSKEALESLNEELTIANGQLQQTLEQQQLASSALSNLLTSLAVATILLDADLRIKMFNPRMRELFALIETDIGRPLADLEPKFADPDLIADAQAACSSGVRREREIRARSGAWYVRSAMPYETQTGEIHGAIITFTDVTALKRRRTAFAGARRHVEAAIDAIGEPIAVIDDELRLVSANTAWAATFGGQRDQMIGRALDEPGPAVPACPPLLDLLSQFLACGEHPALAELELEQSGGERRLWRATVRSLGAGAGERPLFILALEDITDRRRILAAQLQMLIEAMPLATLVVDADRRIRFLGATTTELFGYSPSELLGQSVDMLIPPELRERHREDHDRFVRSPSPRPMDLGLDIIGIAKNGSRIPLDISLGPVMTAAGPLVVAAIHDLRAFRTGQAERDRLRAELAAELADMRRLHAIATRLAGTAELHAVLEEILVAAIELQGADFGHVQLYDPRSATLRIAVQRGFEPASLKHFAVARADDGSCCGRALAARATVVIEDVDQDAGFAAHRAAAAEAGYRAVQSTPILARDGAVVGMLSTHFRAPHRPAERELRLTDFHLRMAAELIGRAQAEEAIAAARRAAEQASQAKSRFLAAVGHDLRQPLQTIKFLQGTLEQQAATPQARAALVRLEETTDQMADLVDALLDLNQIESGRLELNPTDVSVPSLFARAISDFTPLATAKALQLRCVPFSASIRGDRRLLARILGNVLSNAIKYTDRGKILLGCRRRGDSLRIEVWDTGIGIHPDHIGAVFDEFYRIKADGGSRGGLGLGLSITKRFADQLGYSVEIRSRPGKGTMLALIVPGSKLATGRGSGRAGPDDAAPPHPGILLVEDDAAQLEALSSLLELQGYHVVAARDGTTAMASLRRAPGLRPQVIIADLDLPGGMAGTDVVRHVRDELNCEIPALILSGREAGARLSPREAGSLQFVVKPVKPAALLAAIEALVRQARPDWQGHGAAERRTAVLPSAPDPLSEIAIIDDEPGVREALRSMLGADGRKVETFASGEAFLSDAGHGRFRCLIVDISLAGMDGLTLQARLKSEGFAPPIIFVTGSADVPMAVEAMRNGAADFLEKPVSGALLRDSVVRALKSATGAAEDRSQRADARARLGNLSPREREVMDRVVAGQLNKNIAVDLGISERTTEHHRQSVMRKMGAASLATLVRMATSAAEGD
jgi:two-component system CheB/CheR fusion protein